MDADAPRNKASWALAEEVLRTVYGDDLTGCPVTLDAIGSMIEEGFQRRDAEQTDLLAIYEKLTEAVHLLSTPPEPGRVNDAEALRNLLGERLDAIQELTKRTLQATSHLNRR